MKTVSDRDFLKAQTIEVDRLLALSGSHPIMGPQLQSRRAELQEQLSRGYDEVSEPPGVQLYFSGGPVRGSEGIDAKFAAESIRLAQEMVSSQYAAVKHGQLGERGVRRDEAEAKLLLTGLPRGSFGLELSKPHVTDWVAAQQLQGVLDKITNLIAASAESDAAFDNALEAVPWRVIDRLRDFLLNARNHGAALRLATRNRDTRLDQAAVSAAAMRVEAAAHEEGDIEITGSFRGARLDAWQFDFIAEDGSVLGGRISGDISEELVVSWNRQWTNSRCVGAFHWSKVTTTSLRERKVYELRGIRAAQ